MTKATFEPGWLSKVIRQSAVETLTWPEGYRGAMKCGSLRDADERDIKAAIAELQRRIRVLQGELNIRDEYGP